MFGKNSNKANEHELQIVTSALKKGSAEAFNILYHRYNQRIYRFCLRMLGNEAAAKDAFQETFIRVYEHRKTFRGNNFRAWLFTIARNTCLNAIRVRKDHESFDEMYHLKVDFKLGDVALNDQIQKAIATLPISLKEALLLREYEGYSYKEIAEILEIDLSLAKVRVHRARIILRKLLKPIVKEFYES